MWQVETKKLHQKVVQTVLLRIFLHSAVPPLFSSSQVRVEEYLKRLWCTHHRKWKVELPTAQWQRNAWSLFLSTYAPTCAQTACINNVWGISLGIGRALQELPPPHSSSLDHHHLTVEILLPPRCSGSQTTLLSYRAPLPTLSLILFVLGLFVCRLLDLFCLYMLLPVTTPFYLTVLPHQFLFSFIFSLPPCLLQLNKQTNPLPLDTQLRRGDLLCLSGRILSDIVALVNKRKAPEAGGAALFVRRADYLPHTPFCLFSLSGV